MKKRILSLFLAAMILALPFSAMAKGLAAEIAQPIEAEAAGKAVTLSGPEAQAIELVEVYINVYPRSFYLIGDYTDWSELQLVAVYMDTETELMQQEIVPYDFISIPDGTLLTEAGYFSAYVVCLDRQLDFNYTVQDPNPSQGYIRNEYLEAFVEYQDSGDENGRFTIGTTGGNPGRTSDDNKNMLYGHPNPWSSFTTIKIDGQSYQFSARGHSDDALSVNTAVMTINGVEVEQKLSFITNPNTGRDEIIKIEYTLTNQSESVRDLGTRIMLDTMLGGNDNAPFRIPGVGAVTTETEFVGDAIPKKWQAFDDLTNPTVISTGTFYSADSIRPDKVQFVNWGSIDSTLWDYTVTPGRNNGDSAVGVYFDPRAVESGESVVFETYYGLAEFAAEDLRPPLAVIIDADGQFTINQARDGYEPYLVTAYIQNAGSAASEGAEIQISLPDGMSLDALTPDATIAIDPIQPNGMQQVTWSVLVPLQNETTTFEYKVVLTADNDDPKILELSAVAPEWLSSLEIVSEPAKSYYTGQALDLDGLVTVAHYSDGSSREVAPTLVFPAEGTVFYTPGTQTVTVRYSESGGTREASFDIEIEKAPLSDIVVTRLPDTIEYVVGSPLNLSGLVVTALYQYGTSEVVTGYTTTPAGGEILAVPGTQTVVISYTENGVTRETQFNVEVTAPVLEAISLDTADCKLEYMQGDTLDLTGLKVWAHYSTLSTALVTDYTTSPLHGDMLAQAGVQTVTVSYTENGKTVTSSFSIMVKAKPVLTVYTIIPSQILTNLSATIRIEYAGENLETVSFVMYDLEGVVLATATGAEGVAKLYLETGPQAAGSYTIEAFSGDVSVGVGAITVVPYDTNIWTVALFENADGFVCFQFNADISARDGKFDKEVTLAGSTVTCTLGSDGRSLVTNLVYDELPVGAAKFTVAGIKYPALFPSYSFTFTVNADIQH